MAAVHMQAFDAFGQSLQLRFMRTVDVALISPLRMLQPAARFSSSFDTTLLALLLFVLML
jgi:hypothetical protein